MAASELQGICKLTQGRGKFVKSHIIPESLTSPSTKANAFLQYRGGSPGVRPVRRWSSWYDSRLVTEEGERHLSALDNWAVHELRKHCLVWSGWGGASRLPALHTPIGTTPIGVRQIDGIEPIKFRLFFLSLLWRAAATTREEFSEVAIASDDLERLRLMIVTGRIDPVSFYPCQLTQLSTKGVIHNHAPRKESKYVPDLEGDETESLELPTYRFYFDGLIAHMHISLPSQYGVERLGNLIVGADKSLMLSTVTFEDSLQYTNMRAIIEEHGIQ